MPIYEYRCSVCGALSSFLLLSVSEELFPYCKSCGSSEVVRLISRVSILRGDDRRIESLLDPSKFSGLDENDPGSIEKIVEKIGEEMGGEMGESFRECVGGCLPGQLGPSEEAS